MNREDKIKLAIEKGYTCNPETGEVFGLKGNVIKSNRGIGDYRTLQIDKNNKVYQHQFIYYWVNKEIVEEIDHINGDRTDNRIENLRKSNKTNNGRNRVNAKGYTFVKKTNKFKSQITINGITKGLGTFNTEKEAKEAYLNAKKIYHTI